MYFSYPFQFFWNFIIFIILQKSLNITGEESPKTLQEKVLKEEHRCLLEGIRLISEGKV